MHREHVRIYSMRVEKTPELQDVLKHSVCLTGISHERMESRWEESEKTNYATSKEWCDRYRQHEESGRDTAAHAL